MKTLLSMLSTLLCGIVFILLFVNAASFTAEICGTYFQSVYCYVVLIADVVLFTLIMMSMLYTMNVFDHFIY
jgi:hypothetical protein